ncbi:uncharacterized protein LOC120260029 [Dioscorea cayenensis subsp. rotundata]|uniref:Uncharacterized protein LOC120260029 n=1 Tax=Dioscorea cayennensis subsp. rotundata TaxID=55577 RepID=A0AB40B842_DIOCR|nr:uncharacterized protein LOC120260029 [Dioscorea cayenensis subsp. rotundata]
MTPDATHLHHSRPPLHITRVHTADGTLLPISSTGHFSSTFFSVPSISHVPHLSMNLMSVSQLTDYDCQVIFDRTSCCVQDHSGTVIGAGRHHNGVYVLDTLHLSSSARHVHQCHATILSHHMWHHLLGHLCHSHFSSLVRLGVLEVDSLSSDVDCIGCKLAMVHTQFAALVKIFRSDSCGEYISQAFRALLSSEGTLTQLSCPRAHPQNGVAERNLEHKGYRCYDPVTRRIHISHDVTFDEATPFYGSPSCTESPSPSVPLFFLFPTISPADTSPVASSPPFLTTPELLNHSSLDPPSLISIESPTVSTLLLHSLLLTRQFVYFTIVGIPQWHHQGKSSLTPLLLLIRLLRYPLLLTLYEITPLYIPLLIMLLLELVSQMLLSQTRSDGSLEHYKSRLVAHGFQHEYGRNYDETFAPVTHMNTIRTLVVVAAVHRWVLHQLDVKNAFLHGDLKDKVYMTPPPRLQAPRAWFERFSTVVEAARFTPSIHDPVIFIHSSLRGRTILLLYVDDMILTGDDSTHITFVKHKLYKTFLMTDLGPFCYFLGIEIKSHLDGYRLSQQLYTLDLLDRSSLTDTRIAATPMELHLQLRASDGVPLPDPSRYRHLVGSLVYLADTHPDISNVVHILGRFVRRPLLSFIMGTFSRNLVISSWHYLACIGALQIAANLVKHELTKHIGVDAHFTRCHVRAHIVSLHYLPIEVKVADFFTKAQTGDQHLFMLSKLKTHDPP